MSSASTTSPPPSPQTSPQGSSDPADTSPAREPHVVDVAPEPYAFDRSFLPPAPEHNRVGRVVALWRLRRYVAAYRRQLAVMFAAAVLGTIASMVVPLVAKQIIDGPIAHHDQAGLWSLGLLALAVGCCEAFLMFARRWIQSKAVLGLEARLRDDIYAHLQQLPMSFHSRWQSGQLLSRATTDLSMLRRFLGFGIIFLFTNIVQVIVVTVLLLHMYWPLGVLVFVSNVPVVLASKNFHHNYIRVSRALQDQQGDMATIIEEAAVGIRVIKAFGRRKHLYNQYDVSARQARDIALDKVRMSARYWAMLRFVPNITLVFVLLFGALAVGSRGMTLGTLVAFMTLMLQLVWPIQSMGQILSQGQESVGSAERIFEVLDTEPAIVGGTRELVDPRGHLKLEGVSFRFGDSDTDTLHDVWLDVAPGETVAIVGATGAGKTTLTSLVPRLQDVRRGRVSIDGVDVRELTLSNLRSIVASAFEDPTLFSMSVRENLALGRADATEAEVREALSVAQADFAYELPWGLDTRVGEQGMSLSGGQRQRLALARAVVSKPKILVLDDTMSALDVETEALVEKALAHVLEQATGIIIAHRASTVLLADKVALLQDGTITHVGSHHELLATVPAYRNLLAADADDQATIDAQEVPA